MEVILTGLLPLGLSWAQCNPRTICWRYL